MSVYKCQSRKKLDSITIGQVPIEVSRYIFYSLELGATYNVTVLEKKPRRSPLKQGGLEIKCAVSCRQLNEKFLEKLQDFITRNYDFDKCLVDDSKTILASLKAQLEGADHESSASDCYSLMDAV